MGTPATAKEYKIFYPDLGTTPGEAFAEAGGKLVFDLGLIMATGGAGSLPETVAANFADSFVSALETSNGDYTKFSEEFKTNLLFSGLDIGSEALPIAKNLLNKYKPNLTAFIGGARNKLATPGWYAQIAAHKSTISPKALPQYGKVIKGSLAAAFKGFSELGAKIDHKNKQIIDAGGKVIATFKDKAIKFTENVVPAGWTKKETLYDVE